MPKSRHVATGFAAILLVVLAVVIPTSSVSAGTRAAGSFTSLTPSRLLDTRSGLGATGPVAKGGTVVLQVAGKGGVPATGVAAVVLNLTVTQPTGGGFVTVWGGGSRPTASNINFDAGQTVPNMVVSPVANGAVSIYNGGTGTVQLVADVFGYYTGGAASQPGMFTPLPPQRLLDTREGIGAAKQAVNKGQTLTLQVGGTGEVPASGVSAVVLNVTATQPATGGYVTVWGGGARPTASSVNFDAGKTVANLVVTPVAPDGTVSIYNGSLGTVQLVADVFGYYAAGGPLLAGGLNPVPSLRLLDTRSSLGTTVTPVPSHATVNLAVNGKGWILPSGVSAVVLNVTVTQPTSFGFVTVWGGGTRPSASNLNFNTKQTVANLVMAPVSASGVVSFYNGSAGTVQLIADVSGFVIGSDRGTAPSASTSHYVRNISDGGATDVSTMHDEGCADALANNDAGPYVSLLHIGAQSQHSPLSAKNPGVALSGTTTRLTYPQLVTALNGYLDGYVTCRTGSANVTVAVATNNDGDFATYTADAKGTDWATQVIEPLRAHVSGDSWLDVVGADDIEAGFASSEAQAETWVTNYLAKTSADFVYTGSADACPIAFQPSALTNCGTVRDDNDLVKTWTQTNYLNLTHGLNPSRMRALPQVYVPQQAWQWANIAIAAEAKGLGQINFFGVLTEHAADDTQYTPPQAWGAMWNALSASAQVTLPPPPRATDLEANW